MSDNDLSNEEIDDLLNAVGGREPEEEEPEGPFIKIYDFLRPDFLTAEQLESIRGTFASLMQRTAEILASRSSAALSLELESFDQITTEELVRVLPDPCCAFRITFPEKGNAPMYGEVSSTTAAALGALILGIPLTQKGIEEDLSNLSSRLIQGIARLLAASLSSMPVECASLSSPAEMKGPSSYEAVLCFSLKLNTAVEGTEQSLLLNLFIPRSTLIAFFPADFASYAAAMKRPFESAEAVNDDFSMIRKIIFPLKRISLEVCDRALTEGAIEPGTDCKGRIRYREE